MSACVIPTFKPGECLGTSVFNIQKNAQPYIVVASFIGQSTTSFVPSSSLINVNCLVMKL